MVLYVKLEISFHSSLSFLISPSSLLISPFWVLYNTERDESWKLRNMFGTAMKAVHIENGKVLHHSCPSMIRAPTSFLLNSPLWTSATCIRPSDSIYGWFCTSCFMDISTLDLYSCRFQFQLCQGKSFENCNGEKQLCSYPIGFGFKLK